MSERVIFRASRLPRTVVVIESRPDRQLHLLKCSRRRLGQMMEAAVAVTETPTP